MWLWIAACLASTATGLGLVAGLLVYYHWLVAGTPLPGAGKSSQSYTIMHSYISVTSNSRTVHVTRGLPNTVGRDLEGVREMTKGAARITHSSIVAAMRTTLPGAGN